MTSTKTIPALAEILLQDGIKVSEWIDVDANDPYSRNIKFDGDNEDACLVECIAAENGFQIWKMALIWTYFGGKPNRPVWMVTFF